MPMAETLGHDLGDILVRPGDPGARTHGIFLRSLCSLRRLAFLQCPSGAHDELAELDDADIGRPEMFPGAVLDRALAVLDGRVLLADTGDAGEAPALLLRAVDQVVVPSIAQRHVLVVDTGVHAEAAVELRALGVGEGTVGPPAVGVDPAARVALRHPGLAIIDFARHRRRR